MFMNLTFILITGKMDKNSSMEIKTNAKPSISFYECSWRPCSFKDKKLSVVSRHIRQHINERYSSDGERTLEEEYVHSLEEYVGGNCDTL